MLKEIEPFKTISITGLEKNVGKTTTLNKLIQEAKGRYTLGLTSIGRDGETIDRVTATEKPRIYVSCGTVIATSLACLKNSDITREILETTGINTPMGEIVIIRALSDGYVEIAGPSMNKELEEIIRRMQNWGTDKIFIDGALSRKSLASPGVAEATVMATGAAVSADIRRLIRDTVHTYRLLSIEQAEEELRKIAECSDARILILTGENELIEAEVLTALELNQEILAGIDGKTKALLLRGAVTDKIVDSLIRHMSVKNQLTLLVEDGTKIFIKEETLQKLEAKNIRLRALQTIRVVAITINPTSPRGDRLDSSKIINGISSYISVPVYDVKGVGS